MIKQFKDSYAELKKLKTIVITALLIAVGIILGQFSIQLTETTKVGISFIATQLSFLSWEAKKAVIIAAWSPIGSVGPAYTSYLDGDEELAGFVNTVSILIALAVIPTLAIVL